MFAVMPQTDAQEWFALIASLPFMCDRCAHARVNHGDTQTNKSFQEQPQLPALTRLLGSCQAVDVRSLGVLRPLPVRASGKQSHVELQPTDTVVINWETEVCSRAASL